MGHSNVRIKVRRRKVASLAAYSRQFTVRNCTIPESKYKWNMVPFDTWLDKMLRFGDVKVGGTAYRIDSKGKIVFKNDTYKHEKYPQVKPMMKKHMELIYNKETHKTEKVKVASTFPTKKYADIQKSLWKNLGLAAKMELYVQDKLKKWEKKHPKPCPNDDLFKDEFIPQWEHEKEQALIRIRDFVVSMFDKLPLTGRYKEGDNKFTEKPVTEIKDKNGEGHRVNELDSKSKLLNKAQKATNKEKAKNAKLVATNLKDHKRQKGRVILPQAA